jgi:hypothetical protein
MKRPNERISLIMLMMMAMLLLSISMANALGVSPAGKTISFAPSTDIRMDFYVINSERNNLQISLSAIGELSENIFFEQQLINLTAADDKVPFRVILKLPASLEPGIRTSTIKLTPIFPGAEGNMLSAYITPMIPLGVRVPYPSKYSFVAIVVQNVDEGTPVPIYIEFDNLGSERISNAGAVLSLYEPDGKLISAMIAQNISIEKDSLGKTQAEPAPVLKRGLYSAAAEAYYDGIAKTVEANITFGEPLLRARELLTKELQVAPVSEVALKAYNDWNTEMPVTGFLEIADKKTEMPVFKFNKYSEQEISAFIETSGLAPGEYNLSVTWIYANQIKKDVFQVRIIEKKPALATTKTAAIIGSVCLAIAIIAIFAILIFKRKNKRQDS